MAINPLVAFGAGLAQAYQQRQALERAQQAQLLQVQRQLLDRALSVFPHLPTSGKVALLDNLTRYGLIPAAELGRITNELAQSEQLARQERVATILDRVRTSLQDLPPDARATAYVRIFQSFFGEKLDEDFFKDLSTHFAREGFVKTARELANVAPNLAKLTPTAQVAVLRTFATQMGHSVDDAFLNELREEILLRDAQARASEHLGILKDPNAHPAARMYAHAALTKLIEQTPRLQMKTLADALRETPVEELGVVTMPTGQERWRAQYAKIYNERYEANIRAGMSPAQAREQAAADARAAVGPAVGAPYPVETMTQSALRSAQAQYYQQGGPAGRLSLTGQVRAQALAADLPNRVARTKQLGELVQAASRAYMLFIDPTLRTDPRKAAQLKDLRDYFAARAEKAQDPVLKQFYTRFHVMSQTPTAAEIQQTAYNEVVNLTRAYMQARKDLERGLSEYRALRKTVPSLNLPDIDFDEKSVPEIPIPGVSTPNPADILRIPGLTMPGVQQARPGSATPLPPVPGERR